MDKRTSAILVIVMAVCAGGLRAEEARPAFGISLSGFIKTDVLWDSRQTTSLREGHFLLFPKAPRPDPAGEDVNAGPVFNILSIQTRLVGRVTGPDAFGARTSGLIEGEFFGTADGDTNGFRLRHAAVTLDWKRTELMVGQYWHPLFATDCFPDVVSFNTGAPFQPFARAPQVRLTRRFGRLSLVATALSQRDFASNGPDGASSVYIRNAGLPELNFKAQYAVKDAAAGTEALAGLGVDLMRIAPRLVTDSGYKTGESLGSATVMAYGKLRTRGWTLKAEGVWGQNLHHLTMLGGYGVERVLDPVVRDQAYLPLETLSVWAEAHSNGAKWQGGLFGGYSRNLGARRPLAGPLYGRGTDIRDVVRVAPRLVRNAGKLRLAAEAEWTSAAYGVPDARGRVRSASRTANARLLPLVP